MNKLFRLVLVTSLPVLLGFSHAFADKVAINHFLVKENPFGTNEIAIVATDTAGVQQEGINGDFLFTINGFQENLTFENGAALYHHKLSKSSFIFVKHENDTGTHSSLFYVYKSATKLTPIHISWVVLFAIPLVIVVLGYMFKKFIIIAIVLLCVFIYFNHSNGLSIPAFFETVFEGLKHMFV